MTHSPPWNHRVEVEEVLQGPRFQPIPTHEITGAANTSKTIPPHSPPPPSNPWPHRDPPQNPYFPFPPPSFPSPPPPKLKSERELDKVKGLKLEELWLDGNPLCDNFRDQSSYIRSV